MWSKASFEVGALKILREKIIIWYYPVEGWTIWCSFIWPFEGTLSFPILSKSLLSWNAMLRTMLRVMGDQMLVLCKPASIQSSWSTPQYSCCCNKRSWWRQPKRVCLGSVWGVTVHQGKHVSKSKKMLVTLSLQPWCREGWILVLIWLSPFPLFIVWTSASYNGAHTFVVNLPSSANPFWKSKTHTEESLLGDSKTSEVGNSD